MEFKFGQYLVRFIQNSNDSILRFEDTATCRIYEATLLDRAFMGYGALGGLEFINRIVLQGLQKKDTGVHVSLDTGASDRIRLSLSYTHPMVPKKIVLDLDLMAVRRTSATEDVEVLGRRVRDLETALQRQLAATSTIVDPLVSRIKELEGTIHELEGMSGGMIMLPGGGPPCPEDTTTLELAISGAKSVRTLITYINTTNVPGLGHIKTPTQYCSQGQYILPYEGTICVKSISQIKYLKRCTTLCLAGFINSGDYSFLGEMKQLQYLYITSKAGGTNGTNDCTNSGHNPTLTNISWITNLTNLHHVSFFGCTQLVDITPLKELKNLKILDIRFTGVKNTECLVNPGLTITK
jgi:hypothetical protein